MPRLKIRRLVLDVLKPYDPELHILASDIVEKFASVEGVNITLYEMDRMTQKVKLVLEGKNMDYDAIQEYLRSMNCIVHSLDQVVGGEKIVEDIDTPQD